jgi:Cys-rich repeat protein
MPSPDGGSKVDTAPLADAPPSCSADSACPSGTRCNAGTGCVACFTPTLNTELITLGSQQGCSCNPQVEQAACVRGVAVMCSIDHWITALDGPCMPSPDGGKSSG